ncbi:HAD domain-containing protein [Actinoplanes derwentensis]|uniref:Uncharacterized protein n=1 Tax=Actinoplanes derwentensis TaxID=113562 RepID=A0A1H1W2X5_9ACTN|nr:hypothetical protein [Actinoplanes derwentensis]GID84032.1 hypothetical protein Ade03nite_29560 [Actinoplanes derwentensis]SDS91424.1 hypothetical protein SAMN04489716_1967 [Actinoplanes derwentensis]
MNRPVWLLDVDGVLNATRPGWSAAPRNGTAYGDGHPYRLRWAPALISRIRALHRAESVTVRWCSTWCADADQVERLFALPPLERAWTGPIDHREAPAAKLAAAHAVLDQGRRLIWTDDDAVPTSGPVYDELVATGRALLIAPRANRGLQPGHLDTIEAFVSATGVLDRADAAPRSTGTA